VAFPEQQPPARNYASEPPAREADSLLAVLRRRALIIVVTTLLVGAAAAAFSYATQNKYKTTAQLLFDQSIGPQLNALGLLPPTPVASQEAQDAVAVVGSRRVAEATARKLGNGATADGVQADVTVSGVKNSDVVAVDATSSSAKRAYLLANTYAQSAVQVAALDQEAQSRRLLASLTSQYNSIQPLFERRNSYLGRALSARIPAVRALAEAGTGSPRVIQAAYVPSHKSGAILQTTLLGLLFGLVLGAGFALLREQADRRLRRAEDVGAAFEAPVLATVPKSRALKRQVPFSELPLSVVDSFRLLQTNLRYGHGEPVRSVLVTSSRSGEGKTTIAWNLASVAASARLSVVLIEADLRGASLASRHDLRPFPGLADVLEGAVSVTDAIQHVSLSPDAEKENGRGTTLDVLVAGSRPPNPSALMQSTYMGELLDWFRKQYDLVVVDTTPIAQVADAIALLRHVDGVLVAASVNSTRGPEAQRLREQLAGLDARIFGVVANGGSAASGYATYAPSQPRPA
jgi:polysaccharide biosynthesis transport protein